MSTGSDIWTLQACASFSRWGGEAREEEGEAGKDNMRPRSPLLLAKVFSFSERTFLSDSGVLWSGCCVLVARHPGPTGKPPVNGDLAKRVWIEVLIVGGWLTHGDAALGSDGDFLARSRNECHKLPRIYMTFIWSLACQDTSHAVLPGMDWSHLFLSNVEGKTVSLMWYFRDLY